LSLEVQQDFLFFGSEEAICTGSNQYHCFYENDAYYDQLPYAGDGNGVAGGVGVANTRLLIGYDRVFFDNFTAGARIGYSFGGSPDAPNAASFLPVHAEARAAYWFGDAPFVDEGLLRPFVYFAGGLTEVDSRVLVTVYDGEDDYLADRRTQLHAWRKTGTGFAAAGGGSAIKINNWMGFVVDMRVMQMFGASGTGMALRAGYTVGL